MADNIDSGPDKSMKRSLVRWQGQLLPLMRGALVFLTCFFLVTTLLQYYQLYGDIRQQPSTVAQTLAALEKGLPESRRSSIEYLNWRVRVMLEVNAMQLRHQHINAAQLMRTWTRYTGFLVGMVLALMGAFFILGRLTDMPSQISGEMTGVKVAVATSSPGIIMTVLGCCLMFLTLYSHTDFTVEDRPVYLRPVIQAIGSTPVSTHPQVLDEECVDTAVTDERFPTLPK